MENNKKVKRVFTPEQKFNILKDIEMQPTLQQGLEKYQLSGSAYYKWKRQLGPLHRASLSDLHQIECQELRGLLNEFLIF